MNFSRRVPPSPFAERRTGAFLSHSKALAAPHKRGCLLALLPGRLRAAITAWGRRCVPDNRLGPGGRELDTHCTVVYGYAEPTGAVIEQLRCLLATHGPIRAKLANDLSLFRNNKDGDVLKLNVVSHDLRELNKLAKEGFRVEDKYPRYQPHVTVAYLHPDFSHRYDGLSPDFCGREFVIEQLLYSGADGHKEFIPLCLPGRGAKAYHPTHVRYQRASREYTDAMRNLDRAVEAGEANEDDPADKYSLDALHALRRADAAWEERERAGGRPVENRSYDPESHLDPETEDDKALRPQDRDQRISKIASATNSRLRGARDSGAPAPKVYAHMQRQLRRVNDELRDVGATTGDIRGANERLAQLGRDELVDDKEIHINRVREEPPVEDMMQDAEAGDHQAKRDLENYYASQGRSGPRYEVRLHGGDVQRYNNQISSHPAGGTIADTDIEDPNHARFVAEAHRRDYDRHRIHRPPAGVVDNTQNKEIYITAHPPVEPPEWDAEQEAAEGNQEAQEYLRRANRGRRYEIRAVGNELYGGHVEEHGDAPGSLMEHTSDREYARRTADYLANAHNRAIRGRGEQGLGVPPGVKPATIHDHTKRPDQKDLSAYNAGAGAELIGARRMKQRRVPPSPFAGRKSLGAARRKAVPIDPQQDPRRRRPPVDEPMEPVDPAGVETPEMSRTQQVRPVQPQAPAQVQATRQVPVQPAPADLVVAKPEPAAPGTGPHELPAGQDQPAPTGEGTGPNRPARQAPAAARPQPQQQPAPPQDQPTARQAPPAPIDAPQRPQPQPAPQDQPTQPPDVEAEVQRAVDAASQAIGAVNAGPERTSPRHVKQIGDALLGLNADELEQLLGPLQINVPGREPIVAEIIGVALRKARAQPQQIDAIDQAHQQGEQPQPTAPQERPPVPATRPAEAPQAQGMPGTRPAAPSAGPGGTRPEGEAARARQAQRGQPTEPDEVPPHPRYAELSPQDRPRVRAERKKALGGEPARRIVPLNGGLTQSLRLITRNGNYGVFKPQQGEVELARSAIPVGTYYAREVAAGNIAELLGLDDLVPASTVRDERGFGVGSIQDHVRAVEGRDLGFDSRYGRDHDAVARAAAFDYLICNTDRHDGNWMVDPETGEIHLIDNSLSLPEAHVGDNLINSHILGRAVLTGMQLPDLRHWLDKENDLIDAVRSAGLDDTEVIRLLLKRYRILTSGSYNSFGALPSFVAAPGERPQTLQWEASRPNRIFFWHQRREKMVNKESSGWGRDVGGG